MSFIGDGAHSYAWNRLLIEIGDILGFFCELGTWDLSHVSSCLLGVKVETGSEAAREVKMEAVASSWLVELLRRILLQAFSGYSNVCKYRNTSIQSFKYSFSNAEQQCQDYNRENMVPLSALWQLILNLTQSMKRNPASRFLKQWRPVKIQLTPSPSPESCGKVKSTQYSSFDPCLNLIISK